MQKRTILITGGAGFIGSHLVKYMVEKYPIYDIHVIDSLTYAGDKKNLKDILDKITFHEISITNKRFINNLFELHGFDGVINVAAETHVDNSINDPDIFLETNIIGTQTLINASLKHNVTKFLQVSTDEVYGSLDFNDGLTFYEFTPFSPSSPYSASKAASDFLVKSYFHTYDLPVTISNCSNNYGPRQHLEKFIPTVINSILSNKKIPLYGKGINVRDWIYVLDHCEGVWQVATEGELGETYCIGASCERKNIDIIEEICKILNVKPSENIEYVKDRAGHDYRYAIDNTKIKEKLNWSPQTSFEEGMKKTVEWYSERY